MAKCRTAFAIALQRAILHLQEPCTSQALSKISHSLFPAFTQCDGIPRPSYIIPKKHSRTWSEVPHQLFMLPVPSQSNLQSYKMSIIKRVVQKTYLHIMTRHPALARALHVSRPIPELPPVTIATLSRENAMSVKLAKTSTYSHLFSHSISTLVKSHTCKPKEN